MNEKLREMVDSLFQYAADTQEACALREEVTANCEEHFSDLIKGGMPEEEALRAVRESLNGMEELIPRAADSLRVHAPLIKAADTAGADDRTNKEKAVPHLEDGQAADEPAMTSWTFDKEGIGDIAVSAGPAQLLVEKSTDDKIHVVCEKEANLECYPADGVLHVRYIPKNGHSGVRNLNTEMGEHATFGDVIRRFLNSKICFDINGGQYHIRISLPAAMKPDLHLSSASGSVIVSVSEMANASVKSASGSIHMDPARAVHVTLDSASGGIAVKEGFCTPYMHAHTASGSIHISASAGCLEASSASGSVTASGRFDTLNVKSVSGSVRVDGDIVTLNASTVSGSLSAHTGRRLSSADMSTVSGSARVYLAPDTADILIKASSRTGRVRIPENTAGSDCGRRMSISSVSGSVTVEKAGASDGSDPAV